MEGDGQHGILGQEVTNKPKTSANTVNRVLFYIYITRPHASPWHLLSKHDFEMHYDFSTFLVQYSLPSWIRQKTCFLLCPH